MPPPLRSWHDCRLSLQGLKRCWAVQKCRGGDELVSSAEVSSSMISYCLPLALERRNLAVVNRYNKEPYVIKMILVSISLITYIRETRTFSSHWADKEAIHNPVALVLSPNREPASYYHTCINDWGKQGNFPSCLNPVCLNSQR